MPDDLVARAPRAEREGQNEAVRAYEVGRLTRGAVRKVDRMGPNQWRVQGRHERFYDVDLSSDPVCYCADQMYRGPGCLHELAARLHSGDAGLIRALGEMLLRREKNMRRSGGDE